MKLRKIRNYLSVIFNSTLKEHEFLNIKVWGKLKSVSISFYFIVFFLWSRYTYAVGNQSSNRKYGLELIKRRSKVYQSVISRERGLNFDQLKNATKNIFRKLWASFVFFLIFLFTLFILGIKIQFDAPLEIINY